MTRLLSLAMLLGLSLNASACNIPVFRYALERWQTDPYEIIVFYDELTPEQESFVAELESLSSENNGPANANVIRSKTDGSSTVTESHAGTLKTVSQAPDFKLPFLVVRSQAGQGRAIQPWQGTLDQARTIGLLDSPVRKELVRRIQNGHSVVWLVLKSKDAKRSSDVVDLLKAQCDELATKIKLPEGIGLPGSELHSEIPLLVKFSYLEIDPQDPREQFLVNLFSGVHPESTDRDEPLIVPVFGRGRALEVIPASDVNPALMEDLTLFMSGACSCQVKERNPGFDLLVSTHWNRELFGENGLIPPPAKTVADRDRTPTLLTIPPGRKK
jgi:hypothetical protein